MAKGVLAILGSGETAPGMTKVHRELLSRLDEVRAVNLDTPYGFQLNVPQMTQKLVDYFKVSLQTDLKPLSFTNFEESSGVEKELFRQGVRNSTYVFAGPGSPTYALNQWKGLHLEEDLFEVLENGGSVCFSSAAALTLGAFTAPVYEIYKAGSPLYWLEGLNLMGLIGFNCVVIPHFNNNEGENYDTSCCYLGKSRLDELEKLLPPETAILGIDEHTALIIDLEKELIKIIGKGAAIWRLNNKSFEISGGQEYTFKMLNSEVTKINFTNRPAISSEKELTILELAEQVERGGDGATQALIKLVTITDNLTKHRMKIHQLIDDLIAFRSELKNTGNYQLADNLRSVLEKSNINIEDSKEKTTWQLVDPPL